MNQKVVMMNVLLLSLLVLLTACGAGDQLSLLSPLSLLPPPYTVTGSNWFVNWADFPSVRVIDEDHWTAHWLVRHGFNAYACDVAVSISEDAGRTWSEPIRPHADDTPTELGAGSNRVRTEELAFACQTDTRS